MKTDKLSLPDATRPRPWPGWGRRLLAYAAVMVAYEAAARLGLALTDPATTITPVWPAAGVLLAVLLRYGWKQMWRPALIAVILEAWIDHVLTASPFSYADCVGNTLGPLCGAWLVERFAGGRRFLEHPRHIVQFVWLGAGVSGAVSATCGVLGLYLDGAFDPSLYWPEWIPWCVSDVMGTLLLVPPLLCWSERFLVRRGDGIKGSGIWWLEAITVGLASVELTQFAFGGWPFNAGNYSLEYLCIPALLWAAFRFPGRGVTTLILAVATLGIMNTHQGHGPFAGQEQALTLLQIYLGSTSLLALATAGVVKERKAQAATLHLQADALLRSAAEADAARAEAEQANDAKSQFLSRMSHELRTPLNAILGFGQLLEMSELPVLEKESAGHILKAGRHLLGLINEVLDITRIEAGQDTLSPEPVALTEVAEECFDLVRRMAADRGVQLRLGNLPDADAHVMADRQRLRQVLLNLLSNAVKYNREHGSVTLSCREVPPAPDEENVGNDRRLRIAVADTGAGLSAGEIARLFVPFERLSAVNLNIEGSGLGLAFSKGLTEAMGGRIGVESEPGRGSVFWIELPLTESPLARLEYGDALPPGALDAPPGRVLYIEDNLSNLRLITCLLDRCPGVELLSAMQGGLGLEMARARRPDLILLDLHLPDIPGWEVLASLQADAELRDIPVVVISADATRRQIERLMAAGARAYLTKPIDVGELMRTLEEHLGTLRTAAPALPVG